MTRIRTIVDRFISALQNPHEVRLYTIRWRKLLKQRRIRPLLGSLIDAATGSDPYLRRLGSRTSDDLVVTEVLDFQMLLDMTDPGLSRTLLQFGVREEKSTEAFRQELRRLHDNLDEDITVLDIGANLGYFVIIEALELAERAEIHAIEPVERNCEILRRNIELNEISDAVSVHELAIGAEEGEMEFYLSDVSNRHSLVPTGERIGSITVEAQQIEGFLQDQGLRHDSVNVVRFDLEGYEDELFRQLEPVLRAARPLLLFVELHPSFQEAETLVQIANQLGNHGFEIVSTTMDVHGGREGLGWHETPIELEEPTDVAQYFATGDNAVLLIAKKE